MHILAVDIPNILPEVSFFRPAGRLIWSTLIVVIMTGGIVALAKRPKPDEPTTWAQAMAGSMYVFLLMLIAYGTIPHEWLNFANGYLEWDAANYWIRNDQWFFKTDITKAATADIVATLIYVVLLVGNVRLFVLWQKRPTIAEYEKSKAGDGDVEAAGTSAFGRPMTRKA